MEYIENPKCEELKKQGKIREAAEQKKKKFVKLYKEELKKIWKTI